MATYAEHEIVRSLSLGSLGLFCVVGAVTSLEEKAGSLESRQEVAERGTNLGRSGHGYTGQNMVALQDWTAVQV